MSDPNEFDAFKRSEPPPGYNTVFLALFGLVLLGAAAYFVTVISVSRPKFAAGDCLLPVPEFHQGVIVPLQVIKVEKDSYLVRALAPGFNLTLPRKVIDEKTAKLDCVLFRPLFAEPQNLKGDK